MMKKDKFLYKIKLIIVFIITISALLLSSCKKEVEMIDILQEAGMTPETISDWSLEICYISETRGGGDKIYSKIDGDDYEFVNIVNMIYGASKAEKPNYIFSAEAMCEYKIDLYYINKEEPTLTFYFLQGTGNNLLTYVTKEKNEENEVFIDYDFYTPAGDLGPKLAEFRDAAIEPKDEYEIFFISRVEMMSTITKEDLEYTRPKAELEDESQNTAIMFEFYQDIKPDDASTNSQLYSSETVSTLIDDEYLLIARTTSKAGEVTDLSITELRYNDAYTLVFVEYPDKDIMEEFNLEADNAITIKKENLPLDKWIVLLDGDDDIVDVIDPEIELR